MRCGLACAVCLASAGSALAQPAPDVEATTAEVTVDVRPAMPIELGYAALPGGIHAPSAETLPAGTFAFGALSGYGYRGGLLGSDHEMKRALGDLAIAYAPLPILTVALSLDGRYDKHTGGTVAGGDDGYVGDPHVLARLAAPVGDKLKLGAQVDVWVPGKDAPSIAGSAISVDARALATFAAGPARISLDAGFRLDNSAKSALDAARFSAEDQVSLGVSDYNAAVGGLHVAIPAGKAFFAAEASAALFVGDNAPDPILRVGASGGVHLGDAWSLLVYVEGAKVPKITAAEREMGTIPLVPYEPTITGGLGLSAHFGGGSHARGPVRPVVVENVHPRVVEVIETADVAGIVTDEAGKPVVGAKVTVTLKTHTGTAATDGTGAWSVTKLPIGKTVDGVTTLDDTGAQIEVAVDGKKPATSTLTLGKGANAVAKIAMEPLLPPGQLFGIVKSVGSGKAISGAKIAIEPGGGSATSGADGKFQIDLAPGQYKLTITAPGLAQQQLDVTIDPNGVTIKNIDLHK